MKNRIRILSLCVLHAGLLIAPSVRADGTLPSALQTAFSNLVSGRVYIQGFPNPKGRRGLREEYLGVATNPPKFDFLYDAMDRAVAFRADVPTPGSAEAQLIAWEALEALLQGQLVAGNANLLKGLRVAFPTSIDNPHPEKPGGETILPFGCPGDGSGEYSGANIIDLCYARLHFFRGISAALDFMANDEEGELRTTDWLNTPTLGQYTVFNDTNATVHLPKDPNFTGQQNIQTAGYLAGNLLDRYGTAVAGIGDRLWRAAYFDKDRSMTERENMLDDAMSELQKGIHAQFLAALPLAATFEEDDQGYQLCRVDQVCVSAAKAAGVIDRICQGQVPKLDSLELKATVPIMMQYKAGLDSQRGMVETAYREADEAIWRTKNAAVDVENAANALRERFEWQLMDLINIDPQDPPYNGITEPAERDAYRNAVFEKIEEMLDEEAGSSLLTTSGTIGSAILQVLRASADIKSAQARIDSIPQQIRIEEERVGAVNDIIIGTTDKISAYQLAMGIANSVTVSESFSVGWGTQGPTASFSVTTTRNPGAITSARFQNEITRAQAIRDEEINNINAAATIRNLLLQQDQYRVDLEADVIQARIAIASLNDSIHRINRLIEEHISYYDSGQNLWYYDPALIFEQEEKEIEYANQLKEYVASLYQFSQMLQFYWSEPYQNPCFGATLGQGLYDGFSQAESVFNVYKVAEAENFYGALKEWDKQVRSTWSRGGESSPVTFSLRKDIFGFSELVYNEETGTFETDPALIEPMIQKFRALLLRHKLPADSPYQLRLEFPLTHGQLMKSLAGVDNQPAIIRDDEQHWNIRITQLSARIDGQRVSPTQTQQHPIKLAQYGKVSLLRYDLLLPHNRLFVNYNLPLYFLDPMDGGLDSKYIFEIQAAINGSALVPLDTTDLLPTPFCDRYVLFVSDASGNLNLQNIEDIEFEIKWKWGPPPSLFGP